MLRCLLGGCGGASVAVGRSGRLADGTGDVEPEGEAGSDRPPVARPAEAVVVDYEELPVAADISAAIKPGAPQLHPEAAGNVISWYLEFIDNRDLELGTKDFNGSPRFSTGFVPLRNRPGILIETHMLKDYRARVIGTYDFLRAALTEVNRDPQRLRAIGREADERTLASGRAYDPDGSFPLDFELTDEVTPYELKAFTYETEQSEVSGDLRVVYGREPLDLTIPMYQTFRVKTAVAPPLAYIVPAQWPQVIDVLKTHGIQTKTLAEFHPKSAMQTEKMADLDGAVADAVGQVFSAAALNR